MEDNVIVLLKSINASLGRLEAAASNKENKPADTTNNKDKSNKQNPNVARLNSGLITAQGVLNSTSQMMKNVTPKALGEAAVNLTKFSAALLKYKLVPGKDKILKGLIDFFKMPAQAMSKFKEETIKKTVSYITSFGKILEAFDEHSEGIKKAAKKAKYVDKFKVVFEGIAETFAKIGKKYKKEDFDNTLKITKAIGEISKIFENIGKGILWIIGSILAFVIAIKLISLILGVSIMTAAGTAIGIFTGIVLGIVGVLWLLSKRQSEIKSGTDSIKDIAIAMLIMSGSLLVFGLAALLITSVINRKNGKEGLYWTIGIFVGMGIMIALLSKFKSDISEGAMLIPIIALGILAMSFSVLVLAGIAAIIGNIAQSDNFGLGIAVIAGTIIFFGATIALLSMIPKTQLFTGIIATGAIIGIITLMSIAMLGFAKVVQQLDGKTKTMWNVFGFMMAMIGSIALIAAVLGALVSTGIGALIAGAGLATLTAIIGVFMLFAKGLNTIVAAMVNLEKISDPEKSINTLIKIMKSTIKGFSEALGEVSWVSLGKSILGGNKFLKSIIDSVAKFADLIYKFKDIDTKKIEPATNSIVNSFKIFITLLTPAIDKLDKDDTKIMKKLGKVLGKKGFINAISDFAHMVIQVEKEMNPETMVKSAETIAKSFSKFLEILDAGIHKDKVNIHRMNRLGNMLNRTSLFGQVINFIDVLKSMGEGRYKDEDGKWITIDESLGSSAADTYINALTGFFNRLKDREQDIKNLGIVDINKSLNKFIKNVSEYDLEPIDKFAESMNRLGDSIGKVYDNLVKLDSRKNIVIATPAVSGEGVDYEYTNGSKTAMHIIKDSNSNNQTNSNSSNNNSSQSQQPIIVSNNGNSGDIIAALRGKTVQFIFNDKSYEGILNIG